jgi:hypothetical protein
MMVALWMGSLAGSLTERVAGLVIGGHLLLFLGHDHGAALGAHHDLVLGVLELLHGEGACCGARPAARPR